MNNPLNVVTGATGLLGSGVVEQLVQRGERVRAIVRPTSDTALLRQLGVEQVVVDLSDPAALRSAFQGGGRRLPLCRSGERLGTVAIV